MRRRTRGMAIALLACFLLGMRLDLAVQAQPDEDVGMEMDVGEPVRVLDVFL